MPQARPADDEIDAVYWRLLAGEPDAPSDLIALLLGPLIASLHHKYPSLPDDTWVDDIVTDSLFKFVQDTSGYKPERGSLWNYLWQDAYRDLLNLADKEFRRGKPLVALDPVALEDLDGNTNVEEEVLDQLEPLEALSHEELVALRQQLNKELPDRRDREFLELWFSGERHTEAFAQVLEITHLPIDEQRKKVKQTKDRLRVRLKRLGGKLDES